MYDPLLISAIAKALADCRTQHRKTVIKEGGLRALQSLPEPTDEQNAMAAVEAYQSYAGHVRAQFESECG